MRNIHWEPKRMIHFADRWEGIDGKEKKIMFRIGLESKT